MFKVYLRAFKCNLRRYKLDVLSEYLEATYFKEDRIKQWACWYRVDMFNCEWILDTNMHVEAWHDVLKHHVMDNKKNIRIDKLLGILRSAETNNVWKWTRTKVGIRQHADERWLAMRGVGTSGSRCGADTSQSFSGYVDDPQDEDLGIYDYDVPEYEDRSTLFKQRVMEYLTACLKLIPEKAVDVTRLKIMVQQTSVMRNVLRNAPSQLALPADDGRELGTQTTELGTGNNQTDYVMVQSKKKRKMSPQQTRYKKRRNKFANVTSISALKKEVNRDNLALSMRFGAVGWNSLKAPKEFPETCELQLELSVVKKGSILTLGGVTFLPVIMGMVVPDSGTSFGFEVLNMRVGNVHLDSTAHRGGVHRMHYLYKLCTLDRIPSRRRTRAEHNTEHIIGSIAHRHHYDNTLHFDEMTSRVDNILTACFRERHKLRVTLLSYT